MPAIRPSITTEMITVAASELCTKYNWPPHCASQIAEEYSYPMDGFDLCKSLDKWQSWDTSRDDMEALDELDSLVDSAITKAEREWFAENDIQLPLPIGTRIEEGVIEGVFQHGVARYLVKENGCTREGRHLIIKFEDAVAAKE